MKKKLVQSGDEQILAYGGNVGLQGVINQMCLKMQTMRTLPSFGVFLVKARTII